VKRNTAKTYIVALITGIALFVFFYVLQGAIFGNATSVNADSFSAEITPPITASGVESSMEFGAPEKLIIPSISINAKVQHVGLTATKAMGIPTNFTDVAWYKYGPVPGEKGSAVIDGHVDNGLGLNGVFKKLDQVKVGDDVSVVDEKGNTAHFKVISVDVYPYNNAPTEEIFGATDKKLLRLITCDGHWVKSAKTYDSRLVVTAELQE
jgi:LPXTG-site transpeptidase (sortase) family protein